MSLALGKALSILSLSLWQTSTVRAFSSSLVQHTNANHTSTSTKEITVADKGNEARKRKEWWLRLKDDPERYALRLQRQKERFEGYWKDLSWRDRLALAARSRYQRYREENPIAFSELARERHAAHQRKVTGSITEKARIRLIRWTKHSWVRQLPWKSHTPIVTQDKVRQICATCGSYRIDGAKLWWRRHNPSDPPLFDCQRCYMKNFQHMPEGYENVSTYTELKARKEELDNSTNKQTKTPSDSEHGKHKD